MSSPVSIEMELQVKEKCGNQIVKVMLERIQLSSSGEQKPCKSQETSSPLKKRPENQGQSLWDAGKKSGESDPGRSRPQRNSKSKVYTHFFARGDNSSYEDGSGSGSEASCSDSESEDIHAHDFELESLMLNKTKSKGNNSRRKPLKISSSIQCDLCSRQFKSPSWLENHVLQVHVVDKPFDCGICCKSFLTENMLEKHVKRVHDSRGNKGQGPLSEKITGHKITCDFCPSSLTKGNIWQHLERKHPAQLVKDHLDEPRRVSRVRCDLCPLVFLPEELHLHKKTLHSHASVRRNQCELCPRKFTTQQGLENHILRVHVLDKPFECGICFKSFLTENMLQEHVKRVHEDKHFSCRCCPTKSFQDSASLEKHNITSHRSYNHRHESESEPSGNNNQLCPVCDTWFVTDDDLAKHLKKPKKSTSRLRCELCSELVHTPCRLNLHRQKTHFLKSPVVDASGSNNQFKSIPDSPPAPSAKVTQKSASVQTPVAMSTSTNKFSCVVCSAHFSRRCDLDLHELQETHERWKCPVCAKLLTSKPQLRNHIHAFHSDARPFKCRQDGCGKSFKVLHNLQHHMFAHDPDRVYCKECYKYISKKAFKMHMTRRHRGDATFKCSVCSKTWGTGSKLKQHLLSHTDERPFPCKFCDASYKSSKVATQHMKKCKFWSEDQRKEFATWSRRMMQSAKTRKPRRRTSWIRKNSTGQSLKLPHNSTRDPKSTCTNEFPPAATTTLNGNETDLKLVKQELDLQYLGENSSELVDQPAPAPGPELCSVKLEIIPKQEM